MRKGKRLKLCVAVLICTMVMCGCTRENTVVNEQTDSQDVTTITFFGKKYETEKVSADILLKKGSLLLSATTTSL